MSQIYEYSLERRAFKLVTQAKSASLQTQAISLSHVRLGFGMFGEVGCDCVVSCDGHFEVSDLLRSQKRSLGATVDVLIVNNRVLSC